MRFRKCFINIDEAALTCYRTDEKKATFRKLRIECYMTL